MNSAGVHVRSRFFVKILWPKFGLALLTLASDSSWFSGFVSAQGFTIDEHHDWTALLSSWMMFGHPAARLVSDSGTSFTRGIQEGIAKMVSSCLIWVEYEMNLYQLNINIVRSISVRSGSQQVGPLQPTCAISRGTQTIFGCQFFHSLSRQKPTLLAQWICEISSWIFVGVGSANPFE